MNIYKVLKIVLVILILIFLITSVFFVKDYFDKNRKYNEFKAKVETLTKDNETYTKSNDILLAQTKASTKEKEELSKKLAEKKIQIVYKEKIVYKDGELIIPKDYDELKKNHIELSNLYLQQKEIIFDLEKTVSDDNVIISVLTDSLDDTNKKLKETTDLLKSIVNKPSKFFNSSILVSGGINSDSSYEGGLGYLLTIKEKVHIGTIVSYPLKVQVLVGMRL